MTIIDQLTNIYLERESWHKSKLPKEEADKYHERLLMQGNIITYVKNMELVGYLEFYRLTNEQFGRWVCGYQIPVLEEDITEGPVAVITNMYIDEGARHGEAFDMLSAMFLAKNQDAEFFVAHRRTKKSQPLQIYSKSDLNRLYK